MRLQAMENLGEGKKRKEAAGLTATGQRQKKARHSGSETRVYERKNGKRHEDEARREGRKAI